MNCSPIWSSIPICSDSENLISTRCGTNDKPYFMQLWKVMEKERKINQKELEAVKQLEDFV